MDTAGVILVTVSIKLIVGLMFTYTAWRTWQLNEPLGRTITPKLTGALGFYFLIDALSGFCYLFQIPDAFILGSAFRFIALAILAIFARGVQRTFTHVS